jgi:hypothetical protein
VIWRRFALPLFAALVAANFFVEAAPAPVVVLP